MMTKYYTQTQLDIYLSSMPWIIFIDCYIILNEGNFLHRNFWHRGKTKIETCQDCQSRDDQVLLWQIFSQKGCTWAFSADQRKYIVQKGVRKKLKKVRLATENDSNWLNLKAGSGYSIKETPIKWMIYNKLQPCEVSYIDHSKK